MVADGALSAIITLRDAVPLVPLAGVITGVAVGEGLLWPEKLVFSLTPHPLIKASIRLKARKLQRFKASEMGRLGARAPEAINAQMIIFSDTWTSAEGDLGILGGDPSKVLTSSNK
jgi:hypothetical protein